MMPQYTDLVTTLRTDYCRCVGASEYKPVRCYTCEAADALEALAGEVERLTSDVDALGDNLEKAIAERDRLKAALETIAEEHDAGRHDGLPEPCPAHDADTMFYVARKALGDAS